MTTRILLQTKQTLRSCGKAGHVRESPLRHQAPESQRQLLAGKNAAESRQSCAQPSACLTADEHHAYLCLCAFLSMRMYVVICVCTYTYTQMRTFPSTCKQVYTCMRICDDTCKQFLTRLRHIKSASALSQHVSGHRSPVVSTCCPITIYTGLWCMKRAL
jgi:hypothetical protein